MTMEGLTILDKVIDSMVVVQPIIPLIILNHDNIRINLLRITVHVVNYMAVGIVYFLDQQ